MGVYQTVENRLKGFFHAVVAVWLFFFAMTSVIMIVIMPSSSAHSMLRTANVVLGDVQLSEPHDENSSSSKVQAPDTSDPCLSLIHSGRASSNNNNGAYAVNQVRSISAGTTAAIGLMLGARYAIQPQVEHETMQMYHDASASDIPDQENVSKNTLSISAYRQCKKEFALKNLNNK